MDIFKEYGEMEAVLSEIFIKLAEEAVDEGNVETVCFLLKQNIISGWEGDPSLAIRAIRKGNLAMLQGIMNLGKFDVNRRMNDIGDRHTMLIDAAACGYLDIVKYLIDIGASINQKYDMSCEPEDFHDLDGNLCTPLLAALQYENYGICSYLLHSGANPDISLAQLIYSEFDDENLPCKTTGQHAMVQYLLAHGASANSRIYDGTPILCLAIRNAEIAIVSTLLECGADPKVQDIDGKDCLTLAIQYGGGKEGKIFKMLTKRLAQFASVHLST
jgi:ankyrin repeat protein